MMFPMEVWDDKHGMPEPPSYAFLKNVQGKLEESESVCTVDPKTGHIVRREIYDDMEWLSGQCTELLMTPKGPEILIHTRYTLGRNLDQTVTRLERLREEYQRASLVARLPVLRAVAEAMRCALQYAIGGERLPTLQMQLSEQIGRSSLREALFAKAIDTIARSMAELPGERNNGGNARGDTVD